jgi:hypothetical protein
MDYLIDLFVSYQSEIVALIGGVGLQYLPAGWRKTLEKSADVADWYAEFVDAVLNRSKNSDSS